MGPAGANPAPATPKAEPGHPTEHRFRTGVPPSQCIICHIHPGTNVMNSYIGYMWWDEETEGQLMYPPREKKLSSERLINSLITNPDEAAARGNWSDKSFLANLTDLNPQLSKTQFG